MLFRSNDTATTEIYTQRYTLSLHDALPFSMAPTRQQEPTDMIRGCAGHDFCTMPTNSSSVAPKAFWITSADRPPFSAA